MCLENQLLRSVWVMYSIQLDREKSETDMNNPRIKTPTTTTPVEPLNSEKEGQEAFESSDVVSL
jgi:hypothetical protein